MQRIAVLVFCTTAWMSNASAQGCDEVGDIVGGFAGAATGYGLVVQWGLATNWVAAGLYGAGVAVATLSGNFVGETVCADFRGIAERTAAIYCTAGEYICDFVDELSLSLLRDFRICSRCSPDEIFGAFLMIDADREAYLRRIQEGRAGMWSLGVLPRDQFLPLPSSVLDSYFQGQQSGFDQIRSVRNVFGAL